MTSSEKLRSAYNNWIQSLSRLLLSKRKRDKQWRILLSQTPEALNVSMRDRSATIEIGSISTNSHQEELASLRRMIGQHTKSDNDMALLRLSESCVVERTVQIPKAAQDVMNPVIQNQIERIAPWPEADTCYGFQVRGDSDRGNDFLDVHVVATSRSMLGDALEQAQKIGVEPATVDFLSALLDEPIVLVSPDPDRLKKIEGQVRTFITFAGAASLCAAAIGTYFALSQYYENQALDARLAASTQQLAELGRLSAENMQLRQQRERLVHRKSAIPSASALMEAMSSTLPDGSYLNQFELQGGETRIVGKSDDPTSLITKLEDTPEFEDIRFSAPTTREQGEPLATFSIVGRVTDAQKAENKP